MKPELMNVLTCADHGDGRFYVNPLVCVDAGVDEDEAVEMGFLHSAQSVFDGVVVLQRRTATRTDASGKSRETCRFFCQDSGAGALVDSPACSLCLYTCRGYCRSAQRSLVLHELLYTAKQEGRGQWGVRVHRWGQTGH